MTEPAAISRIIGRHPLDRGSMSGIKRLIHEIHRRSLWQVLAIYLAGAWVGYEVIQSLTEGLGLPDWFPGFAIVLFIIGLPIVLATAFVQEGGPTTGSAARVAAQPGSDPGRTISRVSSESPDRGAADGARRTPAPAYGGIRGLLTWRNAIAGGILAFALWGVIAAGWLLVGRVGRDADAAAPAIDRSLVAVLPFRVSGADPALDYLREGMVDLLAAKLTGEAGPQALDPRTVISAWRRAVPGEDAELPRDSTVWLARQLGAGQVLLGGVVGTASHLVVNASVVRVPSGEVEARAEIEGSPDNLPALVDRLAATLLTIEAGEETDRLSTLTTRSLPALRAYLRGQASYRRGRYEEAIELFETALDQDSTFALAGLGLVSSIGWFTGRPGQWARGMEVAWTRRDRLSERDRAYLVGLAGPRYPEPSPEAEHLAAWQRALEAAPDRPELWFWVGDKFFHYGHAMGIDDPLRRASNAFRRAIALDSSFVPPLQHLVQVVAVAGDTAEVRRLGRLYLDRDSAGEAADAVRWWMASALGDSATLTELRSRMDEIALQNLYRIVQWSEFTGAHVEDGERASQLLVDRAATPSDRFQGLMYRRGVLLNRGRPRAANRELRGVREVQPFPLVESWVVTSNALFAGGDTAVARSAVRELAELATAPLSHDSLEREVQLGAGFLVERWRLLNGETGTAPTTIRRLQSAAAESSSPDDIGWLRQRILILEAILATLERRPSADSLLARLDSLLRAVPPGPPPLVDELNLIAARLHDALGHPEKALEALQRRHFFWGSGGYLATYLREEGRLAALTGDRERAIQAYRHYLALRRDPERAVADEVDRVRSELAGLVGEPGP